jgi:hypothetical protein
MLTSMAIIWVKLQFVVTKPIKWPLWQPYGDKVTFCYFKIKVEPYH